MNNNSNTVKGRKPKSYTPKADDVFIPKVTTLRELMALVDKLNPPQDMRSDVLAMLAVIHAQAPNFQMKTNVLRDRLGQGRVTYNKVVEFLEAKDYFKAVPLRGFGGLMGWTFVVDPQLNVSKKNLAKQTSIVSVIEEADVRRDSRRGKPQLGER